MKSGGNRLRQPASGAMPWSQGKIGEPSQEKTMSLGSIDNSNWKSVLFMHRFQCMCGIRTHHPLFR